MFTRKTVGGKTRIGTKPQVDDRSCDGAELSKKSLGSGCPPSWLVERHDA
jgi:hypothetical protein